MFLGSLFMSPGCGAEDGLVRASRRPTGKARLGAVGRPSSQPGAASGRGGPTCGPRATGKRHPEGARDSHQLVVHRRAYRLAPGTCRCDLFLEKGFCRCPTSTGGHPAVAGEPKSSDSCLSRDRETKQRPKRKEAETCDTVTWPQPRDAWSPRGWPRSFWEERPCDAWISDSGLQAWDRLVPAGLSPWLLVTCYACPRTLVQRAGAGSLALG